MKKFERTVSKTQSDYQIELTKKYIKQQCSYNLPIEVEDYLLDNDMITPISNSNPRYINYLVKDNTKVYLGRNLLAIIGEKYNNSTNRAIFTHTEDADGSTPKIQLKKTEFAQKGKGYEWFVELYNNNYEGANFVTSVDIDKKVIVFEVELTSELLHKIDVEDENIVCLTLNSDTMKSEFKKWLTTALKEDGTPYSSGVQSNYLWAVDKASDYLGVKICGIHKYNELQEKINAFLNSDNLMKKDREEHNNTVSCGLKAYLKFYEDYFGINGNPKPNNNSSSNDVMNHNVFGIHITKLNDALSDTNPHIALGWSGLGSLEKIATKNDLDNLYSKVWPNSKPKAKGQDVGQLWRFINETKIGDYVIFAEPTKCHIGRIVSDYYYSNTPHDGEDPDYVNVRKVEWLVKDIDRKNTLSLAMHKSLATSMSYWRMNDYKSAISDLIKGSYVADDNGSEDETVVDNVVYKTNLSSTYSRNRIIFGAPGTGKSYELNNDANALLSLGGSYERVTFHPDYTYSNFVGCYKPVPFVDASGKEGITYEYVPGPFMRLYVKALKNARTFEPKPYLLLIEEINRAKVASVFGDVFQLLDRDEDEISMYPIQASEDIKKYLQKELGGNLDDYSEIKLPDNMFIWASMNSADQGVFPMDTAFKRRWDFKYIGINDNEALVKNKFVRIGKGNQERIVEWNELRKAINDFLSDQCKINEDKLLGPYFIGKKVIENGSVDSTTHKFMIEPTQFIEVFKNKVLMYLFDDAAKQKRSSLFGGLTNATKYSDVIKGFDESGVTIFAAEISDKFEVDDNNE